MIENFENVKRQLAELSSIINSFKSEAVQLRIIELILGTPAKKKGQSAEEDINSTRKRQKRRRKPALKKEGEGEPIKKKATAGTGAYATINQLATTDFFETPKTIGDIIQHCDTNLARRFKPNQLSGKLARMVRDQELKREKNVDGQYEYKKS